MIRGIGVDVVDVARFARTLERTPRLVERLFAESERGRAVHSLAAGFAAKEALIKALGGSQGLRWHDLVLDRDASGAPSFRPGARLDAALRAHGADRTHVSLSHDAGVAVAFAVIEGAS